jgi:SAM-dependent methyltransferase
LRAYEAHEQEYRRMRERGIATWGQRGGGPALEPDDLRFLEDVLAQGWAPKAGRALEVGCGTGPLARWLAGRGYAVTGLDVSPTAIAMARAQTEPHGVTWRVGDICAGEPAGLGRFDLVLDGRALHCITRPADRGRALANVRALLRPGGVFVLMGMCAPIDRRAFRRQFPSQRLSGPVVYAPAPGSGVWDDAVRDGDGAWLPTRYVAHWRRILAEVRATGFEPVLHRVHRCGPDEPVSALNLAACLGH